MRQKKFFSIICECQDCRESFIGYKPNKFISISLFNFSFKLRLKNKNKNMNFEQALELLKTGASVARNGWNGANQFLTLQKPNESSKMTLPYIYITTVQGDRVPWLASQIDMLSEDWGQVFFTSSSTNA